MVVSIGFLVEFYVKMGYFRRNFEIVKIFQNALVRVLFWGHLSNSFECDETEVIGVFEVAEHESVFQIQVAPFLVALGPFLHEIWA